MYGALIVERTLRCKVDMALANPDTANPATMNPANQQRILRTLPEMEVRYSEWCY